MTDEDSVGYLGAAPSDDPYGAPADDPYTATEPDPYGDPYGAPAEEEEYSLPPASSPPPDEVVGYLGGSDAPAEDMPALPPVEEHDPNFSHRDFMDEGGGEDYQDDPYADQGYADPYEMPADQGYDDGAYDDYDSAAASDTDPSYFDSLGHTDDAETGMATQTEVGYDTEEFADDDQPKTISQQDAESIIRRITTKRILPPEQQQAKAMSRPQPLSPGGGGLRIWPILVVLLLLSAGGVFVFRKTLAKKFDWLAFLDPQKKQAGPVTTGPKIDPEAIKKKKLLKLVRTSEAKAFDMDPADLDKKASVTKTGEGADTKTDAKTEDDK
jgi:hypothetical protein